MIQPFLIRMWFLGWPCDPNYHCAPFSNIWLRKEQEGKNPQQVIRANIAGLCIEWNKCEAIPYFWSYFLITSQRMDFVVVSPMDLLHLFHWPRLLQLNVHQFVRISWLSFFPFPINRALFFLPLSLSVFLLPDWVDVQLCDYDFSGVRDFLFFNVTSLSLCISGCPRTVRLYVLCLWPLYVDAMELQSPRPHQMKRYMFSSAAYSIFPFVVKIVFRYPPVNTVYDENECEKSNENLTMI